MSRFRLLFEGELRDGEDIKGVSEQVAVRLEDIADVRLIEVRRELCGCLICKHGFPVEGSYERRVWCTIQGKEQGALECCQYFKPLDLLDKETDKTYDHRIERFNKFFRQI